MKTLFTLLAAFAVITARAQTAPSATTTGEQILRGTVTRQPADQNLLLYQPEQPNQIHSDHLIYQGIFVELYKTGHPLELINPVSEYGNAWDNAAIDPINGQILGWKFFSFSF